MDLKERLLELGMQGFECSQIMMMIALEIEEKENPDLIRAVSGLTGGMGHGGGTCGALTGGAVCWGCSPEKEILRRWRTTDVMKSFRSIPTGFVNNICRSMEAQTACRSSGDFSKCLMVCAPILEECCGKILELLTEYEILEDRTGGRHHEEHIRKLYRSHSSRRLLKKNEEV